MKQLIKEYKELSKLLIEIYQIVLFLIFQLIIWIVL